MTNVFEKASSSRIQPVVVPCILASSDTEGVPLCHALYHKRQWCWHVLHPPCSVSIWFYLFAFPFGHPNVTQDDLRIWKLFLRRRSSRLSSSVMCMELSIYCSLFYFFASSGNYDVIRSLTRTLSSKMFFWLSSVLHYSKQLCNLS